MSNDDVVKTIDDDTIARWAMAELNQMQLVCEQDWPGECDAACPGAGVPFDVTSVREFANYRDVNEVLMHAVKYACDVTDSQATAMLTARDCALGNRVIALLDARLAAQAEAINDSHPMTRQEFVQTMIDNGVPDAELCDFGIGDVPNGHLPNGEGLIVSSFDGGLAHDRLPPLVSAGRYESIAVNAARWPDRQGLDFNDPIEFVEGTPEQVLAQIATWAGANSDMPTI